MVDKQNIWCRSLDKKAAKLSHVPLAIAEALAIWEIFLLKTPRRRCPHHNVQSCSSERLNQRTMRHARQSGHADIKILYIGVAGDGSVRQ
jgi:hypothetical protein